MFSRKLVLVTFLIGAAICVGLAGIASSVTSIVIFMAFGVGFTYLTAPIYWSIIQDVVRGEKVGGVSGFVHGLANISGIIGPAVTGFIVQFTGHFTSAFLLAGLGYNWCAGSRLFRKTVTIRSGQRGSCTN